MTGSWPDPRAAYIHVPFCAHRCGYCNFTLVAGRDDLVGSYLEALGRELSGLVTPRVCDTLFYGGGTPTHLASIELDRLFSIASRWLCVMPGGEISIEANPANLDAARVDVLDAWGINRVSLGAQSFQSTKLELLERDHRAVDIERSVAAVRKRVRSVSLDLIFGVPGESLSAWEADLQCALRLEPDHVSVYGLTFERGTSFWSRLQRGELRAADEDNERAMYELAIDRLVAAGFEHYEVSNFARPGHRCRHNETYWSGEPYFAFGPGAARYVAGRRETNHRSTSTYLRRVLAGESPTAESETLEPEDRARERLVFGLRRLAGVSRDEFERQTGFKIDRLVELELREFVAQRWLSDDGNAIRLTREGLLLSDALWPAFLRV